MTEWQLNDFFQFISDKFKEYEEHQAKKNELIANVQSEVRTLSSKVLKLEKEAEQQEQYSRKIYLLVHGIREVRDETTEDIIIETTTKIWI